MLTLADGVRLHVSVTGPKDAPVTVVLSHGWCQDRRTWRQQIVALDEMGHKAPRVIAYDTRGHGRSSATHLRAATLAQLGHDMAEVIRHYAPTGPVVLAGHSMGGMTIMEYAHHHPDEFTDRVKGLLLVSTTAEGHTHTRYGLPDQLATLLRAGETLGAGLLARSGAWRPHRVMLPALRPALRWLLFGDECAAALDRRLPRVDRRPAAAGHAGRAGWPPGRRAGRLAGPADPAGLRRVDRRGTAGRRTHRGAGRRAHAATGASGRGVGGSGNAGTPGGPPGQAGPAAGSRAPPLPQGRMSAGDRRPAAPFR
jgi:pimeloyl-ACP methyl ester carboxylesterase